MSEGITYENFKELLKSKYGTEFKALLFNSRMDCLFAPVTDYTFLIKESDRGSVEYLQKTIKSLKGKQGSFSLRDFATIAQCFATGGEYDGKLASVGSDIFKIIVFDAGTGDVTQSAVIMEYVNFGKISAAEAIRNFEMKEMGRVINATLGRQITEWKLTYNSEYEYNTDEKMSERLILGINAVRMLEFVSKHPECVAGITKKRLECARIMAEKAKLILDAYVIEHELSLHGVAVEYKMPEIDPETGKQTTVGRCIYEDGFALSSSQFCKLQLARILPYVRENAPDRDFSGFEQRMGKYGMSAIRALYERAGYECFDTYYDNEDDMAKRKEMFEMLKDPDRTARLVEQQAVIIANVGIQEYIKENYKSFGNFFKMFFHKLNGTYEKNIKAAQMYIQLNGGAVPSGNVKDDVPQIKVSVKNILSEYREPLINNKMLGWPVGKGEPVEFEKTDSGEKENGEKKMTAADAVEAYKAKLNNSHNLK